MAPPGANGLLSAKHASIASLDPHSLVDHLVKVLDVMLGASKDDLESPGSLLSESKLPDTLQRCTRFALEPQEALYVQQDTLDPSQPAQVNGESGKFPSDTVHNNC